jgi:SAM-dependent methyltransferase
LNRYSDKSQGWNSVANHLIEDRAQYAIGAHVIQQWSEQLPEGSQVLELGCGAGFPVSSTLLSRHTLYAVEPAPILAKAFTKTFPKVILDLAPAEESTWFERNFDGIVAIGVFFLLNIDIQLRLLERCAHTLYVGGRLLFSAPWQCCYFHDSLTNRISCSLGREAYVEELGLLGLKLDREFYDEGENNYFSFIK